jgi:hypothetical protein
MRRTRADLVAHVGGAPSATQRALIDRAVMLTVHLAMIDRKALQPGAELTEFDRRQYLAWSNALTRLMRQLGPKCAAEKPPSLSDYIAQAAAE